MPKLRLPMIAAVLFATTPALAQNGPASAPVTSAGLDPKSQKISCRDETHTGTRIAHQVCRSAAEWAVLDDATSKIARKFVDDVVLRGANTGTITIEDKLYREMEEATKKAFGGS